MDLDEARAVVASWRDADEELPIPSTEWGHQLATAVDILLEATA